MAGGRRWSDRVGEDGMAGLGGMAWLVKGWDGWVGEGGWPGGGGGMAGWGRGGGREVDTGPVWAQVVQM